MRHAQVPIVKRPQGARRHCVVSGEKRLNRPGQIEEVTHAVIPYVFAVWADNLKFRIGWNARLLQGKAIPHKTIAASHRIPWSRNNTDTRVTVRNQMRNSFMCRTDIVDAHSVGHLIECAMVDRDEGDVPLMAYRQAGIPVVGSNDDGTGKGHCREDFGVAFVSAPRIFFEMTG
jgi:hypothetical protein